MTKKRFFDDHGVINDNGKQITRRFTKHMEVFLESLDFSEFENLTETYLLLDASQWRLLLVQKLAKERGARRQLQREQEAKEAKEKLEKEEAEKKKKAEEEKE